MLNVFKAKYNTVKHALDEVPPGMTNYNFL